MNSPVDPLSTPLIWREFLYNDILLRWETKSVQIRSEIYNKKDVTDKTGLLIVKKNKLTEMRDVEAEYRRHTGEFLVFHANGKAYTELFKRLRDTVAHAHYAQGKNKWLTICHSYQGRGETKANLRLMGRMKFITLKNLLQFIAPF
jgi:hypothetical protein